jgi:hypothetical protein
MARYGYLLVITLLFLTSTSIAEPQITASETITGNLVQVSPPRSRAACCPQCYSAIIPNYIELGLLSSEVSQSERDDFCNTRCEEFYQIGEPAPIYIKENPYGILPCSGETFHPNCLEGAAYRCKRTCCSKRKVVYYGNGNFQMFPGERCYTPEAGDGSSTDPFGVRGVCLGNSQCATLFKLTNGEMIAPPPTTPVLIGSGSGQGEAALEDAVQSFGNRFLPGDCILGVDMINPTGQNLEDRGDYFELQGDGEGYISISIGFPFP